jgi:hypothetical protein
MKRSAATRSAAAASVALCVVAADGVVSRLLDLEAHARYLRAVLGCGLGVSEGLVVALSLVQLVASVGILTRGRCASARHAWACAVLAGATAAERVVYRELLETHALVNLLLLVGDLGLLVLLRHGIRARASSLGPPERSTALSIENWGSRACTRARTATYTPVVAAVFAALALVNCPILARGGAQVEVARARMATYAALFACACLVSGLDRSPSLDLWALVLESASVGAAFSTSAFSSARVRVLKMKQFRGSGTRVQLT